MIINGILAGFLSGDILDSVNGVKLNDFTQLKEYVSAHVDDELEIKVRRPLSVKAVLKETDFDSGNGKSEKRRMLGIQSTAGIVFSRRNMTFGSAVQSGFAEAWDVTVTTLRAVGQMVTGQRGGKDVGGIIRIAEMSGDVSKSGGLIGFIYFMALLSVNLGLELQFQVWRDEPRIRQKQAMWYDLTLFDVERDFFGKLEQGYSILSVSDLFHCTAWNATEYLADEQSRDKENSCWKGMQKYLSYCKKHGITRNYLVKKEGYDGIDAMKFYDKSAVAKFEKNKKKKKRKK